MALTYDLGLFTNEHMKIIYNIKISLFYDASFGMFESLYFISFNSYWVMESYYSLYSQVRRSMFYVVRFTSF